MKTSELTEKIENFEPVDGNWLAFEGLLERVFASGEPQKFYPAIFAVFERNKEDDGEGVFWSAVHGMEAVGGYEEMLVSRQSETPTLMGSIMLRRIENAK